MSFRQFIGVMIGIGVICMLFLFSYLMSESNAIKNIENICRWQWRNFQSYGNMIHSGYINQDDSSYNYIWHNPGLGYNAAVVEAQPKGNELDSFVGIALAPTGNQVSYVCVICKSNNSKVILNTSTMLSGNTINCPFNYHFYNQINP